MDVAHREPIDAERRRDRVDPDWPRPPGEEIQDPPIIRSETEGIDPEASAAARTSAASIPPEPRRCANSARALDELPRQARSLPRAARSLPGSVIRGREPERPRSPRRDLDEGIERVARERLLLEPVAERRRELPGLGRRAEERERLEPRRITRACGPATTGISTWPSSSAPWRHSVAARETPWISSMKRTSPFPSAARREAPGSSPEEGPEDPVDRGPISARAPRRGRSSHPGRSEEERVRGRASRARARPAPRGGGSRRRDPDR